MEGPEADRHHQLVELLLVMTAVAGGFVTFIAGGFFFIEKQNTGILTGVGALTLVGSIGALVRMRRPRFRRRRGGARSIVVAVAPQPTPASCVHLQPIESLMRSAGVTIRAVPNIGNQALCRVHSRSFERRFGSGPATYSEYFQPERYAEDNPTARIGCSECGSSLFTLHPLECSTKVPWFPVPPPALRMVAEPPWGSSAGITAIAVSPSGRVAAVASGSQGQQPEVVVWDVERYEALRRIPVEWVMRSLAWTPDDRLLIGGRGAPWPGGPGSRGPSLFVFDSATGDELRRFGDDLFGVRGITVSPDGGLLLFSAMLGETRADGSSVDLWESGSGRMSARIARVEGAAYERLPYFTDVAFSPDGRTIFAGCDRYALPAARVQRGRQDPPWWWGRGVRVWGASRFEELDLVRHHAPVSRLSISSDGKRLLLAGDRFGVWSLADGGLLWDQASSIEYGAAASADGRLVARGKGRREDNHGPYVDTIVEVYDGATGELLSLEEQRTPPRALAFLPGGQGLISGGEEGELRFWAV